MKYFKIRKNIFFFYVCKNDVEIVGVNFAE